ncbi:MAG: shufflon system plasmid conjugative transfer pilus tip adhesin PilV [Alphaproteobacteria bacterium]|nr:shufflon system plasmid conjugative transfer pilus tip adhesin PilV [Alphaproteobacteria bacterium]
MSLFGSLLALGLLGMMVVAAVLFLDRWMLEERARIAARQLTVLTHAAESHVSGRFPAVLAAVNVGPAEITVAALKSAGALPAGFSDVNALGRGYRVLMLAAGADALDLMVTETVPAGDAAVPAAALLATDGRTRMGLVAPDLPRRLAGPVVDADVSAFQVAFGGAPAAGALATLRRLDHREVYGDQLYRTAVPGFADANRMETDLDLGGNDLTGAGNVEAETLTLESDLTVGGDLTVADGLMVGRALHVSGPAEVGDGITAAGARIAGTATADSLAVTHELRAAGITAQGAVSAGSVGVQGTVAAGSASLTGLQSDGVTARTVTATQVSAAEATAMAVRATARANAAEAGFSRLIVGTCTGC